MEFTLNIYFVSGLFKFFFFLGYWGLRDTARAQTAQNFGTPV
jgi:hypothetical protein